MGISRIREAEVVTCAVEEPPPAEMVTEMTPAAVTELESMVGP
jgi:hypothetical protein